ncbi:hypothetical protein VSX39_05400 (plasmid) [Borreliella burgdorferi]|uniref:hypothetical protein n=1 Tax=Borreliella burgdorferi TaxID=139 RepID=UPI001E64E630|nr:hypothetical protein [Borreliella burgdorferi]MCD2320768.1 hypothetical protein [Borreliella burgdorferi]
MAGLKGIKIPFRPLKKYPFLLAPEAILFFTLIVMSFKLLLDVFSHKLLLRVLIFHFVR